MKWFWISLIGFCLLMCSCVAKKVSTDSHVRHHEQSELSVLTERIRIDTARTQYTEQVKEHIVIKETTTIKEYDKDTGVVAKETKTEREFAQGIQTDIKEESFGKVTESVVDSLGKVENVTTESETEENSVSGNGLGTFWESFGKYLGIACGIALFFVYLCRKFRVN